MLCCICIRGHTAGFMTWKKSITSIAYLLLVLLFQSTAEQCSTDGEVRLVGSRTTTNEGRVEICLKGEWGTVCDHNWGSSDAHVVCKQLGLPAEYADALYRYGGGVGPIHYAGFHCLGTEAGLASCQVTQNSTIAEITNCRHFEDAGVRCTIEPCLENAVRLNEEVVQVCHNKQWGLVCANAYSWNQHSAQVTCRQVKMPSANPRAAIRRFQFYDAPVILSDVLCTASEEELIDCSLTGYGVFTNCTNISVAHCEVLKYCSGENTIQLTGFSSDTFGRLEVCTNNVWGTVCGNGANDSLAKVACRELNHAAAGVLLTENDLNILFDGLLPIKRTNVVCTGGESLLSDCSFNGVDGDPNCTHQNDVIVVCAEQECSEGNVRLVDGSTAGDGQVQICIGGLWGSVCNDRWDTRDAQVVCRQLLFDGPSYPLLRPGYSGNPESLPIIHLDGVHCDGSESVLAECSHNRIEVQTCSLGEAEKAGVMCTNTTCVDGTVHLVGGDSVVRGRVEYCYQGSWYTICTNGWNERGIEPNVICSSLGYTFESIVANYGRGSSPILPYRVQCAADDHDLSTCIKEETDVSQCKYVAGVDCAAFCLTVGLTDCEECGSRGQCGVIENMTNTLLCNCYSDCYEYGDCCTDVSHVANCTVTECETGQVRLVGGVANSTGRLEVCGNGIWGRVCNRLGYWSQENAQVVCRQLGFSDQGAYIVENILPSVFGTSEKDYVFGEIHCIGAEPELLECSHTSIGFHHCGRAPSPDIIISCFEDTSCTDGDVRLTNGIHSSNGIVEYCQYRTWGNVCSEGWDKQDAEVVCRQLGYNSSYGRALAYLATSQDRPINVGLVECSGNEGELHSCTSAYPIAKCDGIAGVICDNMGRCVESAGTLPEAQVFGVCEAYMAHTEVCHHVLTPGIDYVYVSNKLNSQKAISAALNSSTNAVRDIIANHSRVCVEHIFKLICMYYLPFCGKSSHIQSPTSICQEECSIIQQTCHTTWQALMLSFRNINPVLACKDTSQLLMPLPHCCTGAVIITPNDTVSISGDNGAYVGIVIGVPLFIMITVMIVVLSVPTVVVYRKWHKKRKIEMMQHDIMAAPGSNNEYAIQVPDHNAYCETPYIRDMVELDEQNVTLEIDHYTAGSTNSSLCKYQNPSRVPSYCLRELSRGKFMVCYKDITLLESVGEGEFGIVYKAKLKYKKNSKRQVAVKTLRGSLGEKEVERFVEESLKMSRFNHAHVMSLIGLCLDAGPAPLIIMPYMENGSLLEYLKEERAYLIVSEENDEDTVQKVRKMLLAMCWQVASGMEYLSAEKYIHRDLAARNCMIDRNFLIKISDFGLCEDIFEKNYFRQMSSDEVVKVKLPVRWMAPESLSDGHFSEKSDVWSYGVTMWEIFSGGKTPYPGTNPLSLIKMLEIGERLPAPYNAACTTEIYSMMRMCWEVLPQKRLTFHELCTKISKYIEWMAGYLQMEFSPFARESSVQDGGQHESEEEEKEERDEPRAKIKVNIPSVAM